VYILEAHAHDEWPINSARWSPSRKPIVYNQTKTEQARADVARDFVRDFAFEIPVVLDNMQNTFEGTYAAWPLRIFIIERGKLTYIATPSEDMLSLGELQERLARFA